MARDIFNIRGAIATKLNGVSSINGVYNYEIDKPTNGQYPFATIIIDSGDGEFGDTIRNIRRYRFNINVYQERTSTGFGNEKAERLAVEMLDEILTAFDMDTTLSGMVKMIKPLDFNTNYIDREIGDTRVCQFVVEATTVVPSIM